MKLWPRRWWIRLLVLLFLLFSPYIFSRLASSWRMLRVVELEGVNRSPGNLEPNSDDLVIACYNIAHGRGTAASNWEGGGQEVREQRLKDIADLLIKLDADVVVLNEVDFDASWSYAVNQAEFLAREAGYPYLAEQRNLDFRFLVWKWRFGNAVLSRLPLSAVEVVDLPGYSRWETLFAGKKRSLACVVNHRGVDVRIIGAHLSHRSEGLRVNSSKHLLGYADRGGVPLVIAGDLNSTPPGFPRSRADDSGGNALALLDRANYFARNPATAPDSRERYTFHSQEPTHVIDWILIPRNWQFREYRVIDSLLSDHRPVSAVIRTRQDSEVNVTNPSAE